MKCECGEELGCAVTPFMTTEKRVCLACKKVHYIEDKPIDWARVFKEGRRNEQKATDRRDEKHSL
nr:MAG TPA: hypothetical protein [Caudoviricetes sp.]